MIKKFLKLFVYDDTLENIKKAIENNIEVHEKELQENLKYCRNLISLIHTKQKVKSFIWTARIISFLLLIVSLYCLYSLENQFLKDILTTIEIPLIVYIFTSTNSDVIRFKLDNEEIIKEFYQASLPLFIEDKINEQENKDLYNFYMMIQDPKGSYGIAEEEKPAFLNDKSNLEKIIDWFNLKLKGWKRR